MPVYTFLCNLCGHAFDLKTGVDIVTVSCLRCPGEARRQAVYRDQYINGETVAKGGRRG